MATTDTQSLSSKVENRNSETEVGGGKRDSESERQSNTQNRANQYKRYSDKKMDSEIKKAGNKEGSGAPEKAVNK